MEIDRSRLRPMGIGDILDEVFYLYRTHFAILAGICAVLYVPFYILIAAFGSFLGEAVPIFGQVFRGIFLDFLITGALAYAISQIYLGYATSIGDAYNYIGRRIIGLIWTQLLATVVAFLPITGTLIIAAILFPVLAMSGAFGTVSMIVMILVMTPIFLAAIVFSIFLMIRFLVVMPVFVVDGIGGVGALRRSYRLVSGYGFKAWIIAVVVMLIVSILQMVIAGISELLLSGTIQIVIGSLLDAASSAVLVPVIAVAYVLIYFDLRIRKEGLDLEILAQDLERRKQRAEQAVQP